MKTPLKGSGTSTGRRTGARRPRKPYAPVGPQPVESRSEDAARRIAAAVDARVLQRRVLIGLGIVGGISVVATPIAVLTMTRTTFLPGVAFLFLFLVTFGAPYWIAAVHTEGADLRSRIEAEDTRIP